MDSSQFFKIRFESFSKDIDLDQELIELVANDPNNQVIANPATQLIYLYLVDYVRYFSSCWFSNQSLDVLDWGCGKGHITYLLQKGQDRVVSADRRMDAVDSSFGQSTPIIDKMGITVVPLEDDYVLPFEDDSFDVVISMGVLEHVPKDMESVKEIARVLRPNGLFFCFFLPYKLSWTQAILKARGITYHDRLYDRTIVNTLTNDSGLEILDFWHRQLFPKHSARFKNYRTLEKVDQWLTFNTFLKYFATNIEFVCVNVGKVKQ